MTFADSLPLAFVLGVAFGFTLERAGLASAPKLAGQFYLTDFTVFKVMFSAIVTAMLGAFWLGRIGVIDFSSIYIPETFVGPQIVGGLIFGAGFVVSGLCPGTSCVAAATGRGDGVATVLGVFGGVTAAGLAVPALEPFFSSGAHGAWTVPDALHLPYGVVVLLVVVTALAGFGLADRLSRDDAEGRAHKMTRTTPGIVLALGLVAAFAGAPYPATHGRIDVGSLAALVSREEDHVTALELAQWIRDRKPGLRVIDVRTAEDFAAFQIPTAEHVAIDRLERAQFNSGDTIVLYSDGGAHAAQAWVFLRALGHRQVYFLRGGLNEWLDDVMSPVKSTDLTRYFGGVARPAGTGASGQRPEGSATERAIRMKRRGC